MSSWSKLKGSAKATSSTSWNPECASLLGDFTAAADEIRGEQHAVWPLRGPGAGSALIDVPLVLLPLTR